MSFITANSKNLGSRTLCNLSFFEGHLMPASKPFESPISAKGATTAKNAAESELELSKQVAMPTKKEKSAFTTRATDKVFGISCKLKSLSSISCYKCFRSKCEQYIFLRHEY